MEPEGEGGEGWEPLAATHIGSAGRRAAELLGTTAHAAAPAAGGQRQPPAPQGRQQTYESGQAMMSPLLSTRGSLMARAQT